MPAQRIKLALKRVRLLPRRFCSMKTMNRCVNLFAVGNTRSIAAWQVYSVFVVDAKTAAQLQAYWYVTCPTR